MLSKRIGTHDGTFHVDEALACFILLKTEQFKGAEIIRTRKPDLLAQLDVNVDVGGVYDPEKFRFDHHQIGFTGTFDNKHSTKLSSAGLIYKHFGREIIKQSLGTDTQKTEIIFNIVYEYFIEAIDGIDNGIDRYPSDVKPKYQLHTDVSSRVGDLNPWWNDPKPNHDQQFKLAMEMVGKELMGCIEYFGKSWLPARSLVEEAIDRRFEVDSSGEIILFNQFCPWKSHLFDIEREKKLDGTIKFCLFSDLNGTWRVQCVPKREDSFENRISLLWKGLRDEELSKSSGIDGGVFVHISGFIGGNKTKEGVLEMARKSLQEGKSSK